MDPIGQGLIELLGERCGQRFTGHPYGKDKGKGCEFHPFSGKVDDVRVSLFRFKHTVPDDHPGCRSPDALRLEAW